MKIKTSKNTEISVRRLSDLECRLDKKCGKKPFYTINESYLINENGLPANFGDECFIENVLGFVLYKIKFVFYKTKNVPIGKYEDVIKQFIK
jgi:hypothetical protein